MADDREREAELKTPAGNPRRASSDAAAAKPARTTLPVQALPGHRLPAKMLPGKAAPVRLGAQRGEMLPMLPGRVPDDPVQIPRAPGGSSTVRHLLRAGPRAPQEIRMLQETRMAKEASLAVTRIAMAQVHAPSRPAAPLLPNGQLSKGRPDRRVVAVRRVPATSAALRARIVSRAHDRPESAQRPDREGRAGTAPRTCLAPRLDPAGAGFLNPGLEAGCGPFTADR